MTRPSAKIIADSVGEHGVRLTTIEVTLWRPIWPEVLTHRAFSRNSASSRARSTRKTTVEVITDTAYPLEFLTERIGMVGGEPLTGDELAQARAAWESAARQAIIHATELQTLGVHKSIINRLLEPFMTHTAVITATDWDGFFEQRMVSDEVGRPQVDPEIYHLACAMREALAESTPQLLDVDEWHLPYVTDDDWQEVHRAYPNEERELRLRQISVARCAGVSYLSHDVPGRQHSRDLDLYRRLRTASPPHWSPFEHVATPDETTARRFNLRGWRSLRWYEESRGVAS